MTIKAEAFPNQPEDKAQGEQYHVPRCNSAPQPERIPLYWSFIAGMALILVLGTVVWMKKRG